MIWPSCKWGYSNYVLETRNYIDPIEFNYNNYKYVSQPLHRRMEQIHFK